MTAPTPVSSPVPPPGDPSAAAGGSVTPAVPNDRTIPPLYRATAIIATIGVVVALLGLGLLLRPVTTPTQDCGTSLAFILEGRVDEFVSVDDPPEGITGAEATANNERPCRSRVADAAKPGGILLAAGMTAAVGAAIVEMAVRTTAWWRRHRARRAASTAAAPAPPVAPGPPA